MKNNIVLIGMPGCGKSTVGVLLAKLIGYDFLDSDLLIQRREGKKLFQIIDEKGLDYFNELENQVNAGIAVKETVIATGGSVVYGKEAMEHLAEIGTVVYLKVPLKEIKKRVTNFSTRGISMASGMTLDDLYKERSVLYEKYADVIVECGSGSLLQNAEKIKNILMEGNYVSK